jgi:alpha-tubulin suppressor-like RCC1 family protein
MTFRAPEWIGLGLLLAGTISCSKSKDSYLVVHADVDCNVPRVFQMVVTISNGTSSDQKFFPEGTPAGEMGFPSDFAFIVPGYRSGWVGVAVDALDQNLNVIGQGSVDGQLNVGARTDLKVQLSILPQVETTPPSIDGGTLVGVDGGPRDATSNSGDGGSVPFLQVAVGGNHTCAIRVDSTLWCWGNNAFGQLRIQNTSNRLSPAQVSGPGWSQVSCGQSHSCSIRSDGSLSCWGNNASGQLGNSAVGASGQAEVAGNAPWASVSAGSYQTCGVQQDGTLWCWGDDTNGQLGIGSLDNQPSPVQVVETGFTHVSASYLHTCATKGTGSMWCWGLNANEQTGDSNGTYHINPVLLDGGDWVDISTGLYHSCGLKGDNTLWCWGGNPTGQLGNASIPAQALSLTATAVPVDGAWQNVSAGQSHTCAIMLDGSLWCWGDNSSGQLGTGSSTAAGVPVLVQSSVKAWSMVASGISHTCAIASDASLWCWGDNTYGQLGLGNTAAHLSPTKVVQ